VDLLPQTAFYRPELERIKEGNKREGGRNGRYEYQWIVTNAATSSSASFILFASSLIQSKWISG